jgi:hypothetical protein
LKPAPARSIGITPGFGFCFAALPLRRFAALPLQIARVIAEGTLFSDD